MGEGYRRGAEMAPMRRSRVSLGFPIRQHFVPRLRR